MFGNSYSADILSQLLNDLKKENPRLSSKICRIFSIYSQTFGSIDKIENNKAHGQLLELWYKNGKEQVNKDSTIPPLIKEYLMTVEKELYKKFLNKFAVKIAAWRKTETKNGRKNAVMRHYDYWA